MATHADADLILRLYDLRRESVMREGRAWFAGWMPTSAEEVQRVQAFGPGENAWLRQVTSYWEMAFSIANSGAIDATLFGKNCGEGILFCTKCQVLKERFPGVWGRSMAEAEAFIAAHPAAQEKQAMFRKRFA